MLPGPTVDTIPLGEWSLVCWGPCCPGKPIPTLVRETTGTRSHPQGYVHTATFSGREQEECGQMAAVGPQAKEQTLALAHNNSNKQSN